MKFVGNDIGKFGSKVAVLENNTLTDRFDFPTAIGYSKDGRSDLVGDTHLFSVKTDNWEKKEIVIGNESLPEQPDKSFSKDSELHKTCALYGLSIAANPGETIHAAIGCPISIYLDKEKRIKFLENIIPKGNVETVIDGKKKEFKIDKRFVYAEATGVVFRYEQFSKKTNVGAGVVDIGGLNMNITQVRNSSILGELSHTSNHGGRILGEKIKRALMDAEIEIADYQIIPSIIQGYVDHRDPAKKDLSSIIITETITEFVSEIERVLQSSWTNLDTLQLYFVGGTSFLLRGYIKDRFGEHAFVPDDFDTARFLNAEGYAIRMAQVLRKQS